MYLALSSNVITLINYIQISYWLAIAGAIASLFYFRIKHPDWPRPIKVNLFIPIIFFIGCVALVLVPIIGSPTETCIGLGIMLTGKASVVDEFNYFSCTRLFDLPCLEAKSIQCYGGQSHYSS